MLVASAVGAPALALFLLVLCSRLLLVDSQEPARAGAGRRGGIGGPPEQVAAHSAAVQRYRPRAVAPGTVARLHARIGLLSTVIQALVLLLKTDTKEQDDGWSGSVILILLPGAVLPMANPTFYEQHLFLVRFCMRLVWFSQPYMRDPRGLPTVLLEEPSPGALGTLKDAFSLLLGTRTLGMLLGGIMFALPLLPGLALKIYVLQLCRDPASMCALPLLSSAAWERRIRGTHRAIEALPLLVPRRTLQAPPLEAGCACRVFLTFLQLLLGIVVPSLFAAKALGTEATPLAAAAAAAAGAMAEGQAAGEEARQGASGQTQHTSASGSVAAGRRQPSSEGGARARESQGAASQPAVLPRYLDWLIWAGAEAEGSLMHLAEMLLGTATIGPGGAVLAAAAWWLLLSLCWALALSMEP